MNQKTSPKNGFERVWAAFFYSLDGLRYAFSNETAFRQELFVISVSTIVLFFLPFSFVCKCLLWLATINVLVVEILNSAIEAVVDLASPEFHILAKHAKNLGSSAVLMSISVAVVLWCAAIYYYLLKNIIPILS